MINIIFEKSILTGRLPSDWKTARVSILYQKWFRCDPTNYRPISLICILCKAEKHIVPSNLNQHLNKNNILYELEHGFHEKTVMRNATHPFYRGSG